MYPLAHHISEQRRYVEELPFEMGYSDIITDLKKTQQNPTKLADSLIPESCWQL